MDLKEFGSKNVLWIVHSLTRFIQGKLISNKKAEIIIDALKMMWNLNIGFSLIGFLADNGGEFANIKLDKLTSKLGLTISFGPAYLPWSNGLNKRNHASGNVTIKKLIQDKKMPLTDSVVKAAAWTHIGD